MRHAAFAIVVLFLAVPAIALPIIPPKPACHCTLEQVEIPPPPQLPPPPPPAVPYTAEQLAQLKAEDDLHEPTSDWAWMWICPPLKPGQPVPPWMPKPPDGPGGPHEPPDGPHMPPGGDGGGGAPTVPEPSVLAMLFGAFAVGVRRIRR